MSLGMGNFKQKCHNQKQEEEKHNAEKRKANTYKDYSKYASAPENRKANHD